MSKLLILIITVIMVLFVVALAFLGWYMYNMFYVQPSEEIANTTTQIGNLSAHLNKNIFMVKFF
jgi:flagellar basal body-associated protein FliL